MSNRCWALAGLVLLGCGGGDDSPEDGPADEETLTVFPVTWNRKLAEVGAIATVADDGDTIVVFGDEGAVALEHGEVSSADATYTEWRSAAVVPAADHIGTWIIGMDLDGRVHRAQAGFPLEDVSARFGFEETTVLCATSSGEGLTAFGLDLGIAVSNGEAVSVFPAGAFTTMAGAAGKVAVAGGDRVQVLDVASSTMTSYELPGVAHVAFDAESKLLAATPTSVFQEVEGGALGSVYDAPSDGGAIHGLVTSGSRVWMALGTELGVLEAGVVSRTTGVGLPADAKLVASTTGDVWALAAGELLRFSRDAQGEGAELWKEGVEPIFARACSQCHLASGPAGIDLSTYTAWVSRRSAIQERVVVQRNMPPPGADFSEEDRAAIAAWVQSGL